MLKILSYCVLSAGILAFGRHEMTAVVQRQTLDKTAYAKLALPTTQSCSTVSGSFSPAPGSTAPCTPDPRASMR